MKLAEALVHIKDLKGKIAEVSAKIDADCTFRKLLDSQDVPSIEEDIETLDVLVNELSTFKSRVAKTNAKYGLIYKMNEMDYLKFMVNNFDRLAKAKQERIDVEYGGLDQRNTVTTYATYDVVDMVERVDNMKSKIRQLDLELQKLNWEIDLGD